MSPDAELSSLVAALDEVVGRVSLLADDLAGPEREPVSAELFEVERNLRAAQRRLAALRV